MAVVDIDGLGKSFSSSSGDMTAIESISFALEEGTIVSLLGPSGCGKSTILNVVAGFVSATTGVVRVQGDPVLSPGPERGMVFQQPALFPWLTVLDNVMFGLLARRTMPRREIQRLAVASLDQVGLGPEFARYYPHQLSGGMKQRVAIARVLVNRPAILLMDEPFGALDAQTRLQMQENLMALQAESGQTILFVTHDIDEALFISDRVLMMSGRPGRIVREVTVDERRPRRRSFLTDSDFVTKKALLLEELGVASGNT